MHTPQAACQTRDLESLYAALANACDVQASPADVAEDCRLIRDLRAYADAAFQALGESTVPRGSSVDFAFPGAAYFSVACGGFWDILERRMTVRSSSGASGGACSSFMLLAGGCNMLLVGYVLYARHQGTTTAGRLFSSAIQLVRVTSFWEKLYRHVLAASEAAWEAVREKGFVAVASSPLRLGLFGEGSLLAKRPAGQYRAARDSFIFHNFEHREEAVQAYVATGEATLSGFSTGVQIIGDASGFVAAGESWSVPMSYCDGGSPAARPTEHAEYIAYFHTFFDGHASDAAICTPASIERLYKAGVDVAVSLLQSPDGVGSLQCKEKAVLVDRRRPLPQQLSKINRGSDLQQGVFVDVQRRRLTPAEPEKSQEA